MEKSNQKFNQGFTLVEVLIATSIILVFLLALFGVNNLYLKNVFLNTGVVKATLIAEEGLEGMRFLRNSSWDDNIATLSLDTNYHLNFNAGVWQMSETPLYIDEIFERTISLSAVSRDASDDIVSNGGTVDPNTRLIKVIVAWRTGQATTTRSISTYLSNILDE